MKTIKIPKVERDTWVDILKSKSERYRVFLRCQEIDGVTIPKDSTIGIEVETLEFNANGSKAKIPAYNLNRLLRFVYLEKLRKG